MFFEQITTCRRGHGSLSLIGALGDAELIITSPIFALDGDAITFPESIRAPIFGGSETRFFSLIEQPSPEMRHVEILTTAFHPKHWADLWRIEIETYDHVGNTMRITQFLDKLGIMIVASEATINSFGRRHTISYIVNCLYYSNKIDGDQTSRYQNPGAVLRGLNESLFLHFVEQLTLNDRGYPRIKIRRMSTLYRLHAELQVKNQRQIITVDGQPAESGELHLPSRYTALVRSRLSEHLHYSSSVDTKSRVIRTLIFGLSDQGVHHLQLLLRGDSTANIVRVFEIMFDWHANIIKHNIRPIYASSISPFSGDFRTQIDVDFEWKDPISPKKKKNRLDELIAGIKRDQKLSVAEVTIAKVDGKRVISAEG